jgi:5'-methylthioadenosine phosphorylase
MRDPICPTLHRALVEAVETAPLGRVFERGIYVVTDGRHFESRAEISLIRQGPGDIVGQSLAPEVYLAREIGACYAGIYVVVNYAEGVVMDWDHQELSRIFFEDANHLGRLLLDALNITLAIGINNNEGAPDLNQCHCQSLRKSTLLK